MEAETSIAFVYGGIVSGVSGNASKCEGPFDNTETPERGVRHPMLGISLCLRRPNWSAALYICERTQRLLDDKMIALY